MIGRRSFVLSGLAVFVLLGSACDESSGAPVDPVWGKQACAHCSMLVSSRRYAAQIVTRDGQRVFFDDIGCMVSRIAESGTPARAWVRDADGDGWLDAYTAHYRSGAASPMDYGFEASNQASLSLDAVTRAVVQRNARVLSESRP